MKDVILLKKIKNRLSKRAALELLAEEAAELSQAALKLIRAKCITGNPTPVTSTEAEKKLLEEFVDVMISAELVGITEKRGQTAIYIRKVRRMAQRLDLLEDTNE
ncbi:MAG: hypothetical protein IJ516_05490 [Phascolarctobacterium sp.]|nr:hypothetical protein [Phascolarctobacterium sp.]